MALALGFNVLLLLVLLGIGAIPLQPPEGGQAPLVVDLLADSRTDQQAAVSKARSTRKRTETKPLPEPRIILPAKPTIEPPRELPWLELTKAEMEQADIGRKRNRAAGPSGLASSGDSEEVGRGPNGEVLYAAEWARKPTNTELGGYLPRNAPDGWGLIACRTVEGNRVEDCIELGQSPRGSRLASAVRQAAWQFRVRPPRKNGRPLIGSWVQIRIDYYSVGRS